MLLFHHDKPNPSSQSGDIFRHISSALDAFTVLHQTCSCYDNHNTTTLHLRTLLRGFATVLNHSPDCKINICRKHWGQILMQLNTNYTFYSAGPGLFCLPHLFSLCKDFIKIHCISAQSQSSGTFLTLCFIA